MKSEDVMISIRRSAERGHVNHGWLDSYHSFFGEYHDSRRVQFGSLRVINEDRIEEGAGFGGEFNSEVHHPKPWSGAGAVACTASPASGTAHELHTPEPRRTLSDSAPA